MSFKLVTGNAKAWDFEKLKILAKICSRSIDYQKLHDFDYEEQFFQLNYCQIIKHRS